MRNNGFITFIYMIEKQTNGNTHTIIGLMSYTLFFSSCILEHGHQQLNKNVRYSTKCEEGYSRFQNNHI